MILFSIATFVIGVLVLFVFEDWTVLTCVYVIVQIMTTIGYGDVTVSSFGTRMFMSLYVIWCLLLLAHVMNEAIEYLIVKRSQDLREYVIQRLARATDEASKYRLLDDARANVVSSGAIFFAFLLAGTIYFSAVDRTPNGCVAWESGECVATELEDGMTLDEAWYMSVITLTTIGFGDYTPKGHGGRLFCIVWMILGVGSAALFLSRVQQLLFHMGAPDMLNTIKEIDRNTFKEIDRIDGHEDGVITRGEFLSYVLKKYELADPSIVDELNNVFEKLLRRDSTDRTREVHWTSVAAMQRSLSGLGDSMQ